MRLIVVCICSLVLVVILLFLLYMYCPMLVRWLNRKELNELYKRCDELGRFACQYRFKYEELQKSINKTKDNVRAILASKPDCTPKITKEGCLVFVECSELMFCLHDPSIAVDSVCVLNIGIRPSFNSMLNIALTDRVLFVYDLYVKGGRPHRRGYATVLLECLFDYAERRQYDWIVGELSPQDKDSHGWLVPFYERMGFSVRMLGINEGVVSAHLKGSR